jgi:hypothetical protein
MNYEIYGWLITASLLVLVALLIGVTWMVAVENGYDKGFKSGYKRGSADIRQSTVKVQKVTFSNHPSLRERQLSQDNEYLMDKVVSLWDRENK